MSLGKIAKGVLGVAATAAATAVNPVLGGAVGSAFAAGAEVKRRGKRAESRGALPVHKATAPAAAIGTPALVLLIAHLFGWDASALCVKLTGIIEAICGNPAGLAGLGALFGLGAVGGHSTVHNAAEARTPRGVDT